MPRSHSKTSPPPSLPTLPRCHDIIRRQEKIPNSQAVLSTTCYLYIGSSVCQSAHPFPMPRKVNLIRAMPSPQSATLLVSPRAYHPPALLIAIGSPGAHQKPTREKFRGIVSKP